MRPLIFHMIVDPGGNIWGPWDRKVPMRFGSSTKLLRWDECEVKHLAWWFHESDPLFHSERKGLVSRFFQGPLVSGIELLHSCYHTLTENQPIVLEMSFGPSIPAKSEKEERESEEQSEKEEREREWVHQEYVFLKIHHMMSGHDVWWKRKTFTSNFVLNSVLWLKLIISKNVLSFFRFITLNKVDSWPLTSNNGCTCEWKKNESDRQICEEWELERSGWNNSEDKSKPWKKPSRERERESYQEREREREKAIKRERERNQRKVSITWSTAIQHSKHHYSNFLLLSCFLFHFYFFFNYTPLTNDAAFLSSDSHK